MRFEKLSPEQLDACKELKPAPNAPSYFDLLRALSNLLDGHSVESIHFRGNPEIQSVDVDHLKAVKIATMDIASQTFPTHPLCRAYFDGLPVQGKYLGQKYTGKLDITNSTAFPDGESVIFCVQLDKSIYVAGADTTVIYIDSRDDASHIEPIGAPYSTFS